MIFVIRELAGKMAGARSRKHILVGGAGILLGGAFLWLALRNVNPVDIGTALQKTKPEWLFAAVTVYQLRSDCDACDGVFSCARPAA